MVTQSRRFYQSSKYDDIQLLQRNPEKRLGWNGIDEIKHHPWLSDVDWKAIKEKTLRSPYIPLSIEENYDDYK